ncbi:MAG TPA: STAS domain-containing protein [Chitinispirillaceae bacterium]|nr:STAS domain-containing protein [Chitinispirillaceae bacterium]
MKIDITQRGIYQVLQIEEELNVISDLSELRYLIRGYLNQGKKNIAVSFVNASYIYSGAIAVLIDCYKLIKKDNGDLCIIESNPELRNIFKTLHLDQFMQMYQSLEELPGFMSI